MDLLETRERVVKAAQVAVEELIKIAEEKIIIEDYQDDDAGLSADKLKVAAQAKKLAITDALELLAIVGSENETIAREKKIKEEGGENEQINSSSGFAERYAK